MGYFIHHTIVVTSWNAELLGRARDFAVLTGANVSGIVPSGVNGIVSFFVAPDGSKEGWDSSDAGDVCRATIKAWLANKVEVDGSSALDWFEVAHPEDGAPRVVDHRRRAKRLAE